MKRMIFALLLALTASCQKDAPERMACEANNFGSRCFENLTAAPMDVYVDGSLRFSLPPAGSQCIAQVSVGIHQYRAEQPSTGLLWEGSFDVVQCSVRTIAFRP